MPHIAVNKTDIHYQILGEGPPIVMIHGLLLGNLASWYFGAVKLLAESHRVIVYDLRGHGLSGKPSDGYDIATMLSDLDGLVATLGLGEFALVGHSYGALIALHYALRHPQRISRLTLVEGPLPPSRSFQMDEFQKLNPLAMLEALPIDLQKLLGQGGRQGRKLLERLRFLVEDTDLLSCLRSEADIADETLQALRMPLQIIYGDQSQLGDVARRLSGLLPEAKLQWLPGGHYLPSERPLELGRTIGEFMA